MAREMWMITQLTILLATIGVGCLACAVGFLIQNAGTLYPQSMCKRTKLFSANR